MNTRKGFTLIELMIVIAIIAIIAAIAIPNLMASRVRANEATAISALKQIATAQVTFQAGRQGRSGSSVTKGGPNGFCSNYRNLAFAPPVGDSASALLLISEAVANAYITDGAPGAETKSAALTVATVAAPYQGYQFQDDPNVTWTTDFAAAAVPSTSGTTGSNLYWLGQAGTVFIQGVASGKKASDLELKTGKTPNTAAGKAGWTTL